MAVANEYRYLREDAMGEPGRPGPAVERCPHDPQRMAKVAGRGRGASASSDQRHLHDATLLDLKLPGTTYM